MVHLNGNFIHCPLLDHLFSYPCHLQYSKIEKNMVRKHWKQSVGRFKILHDPSHRTQWILGTPRNSSNCLDGTSLDLLIIVMEVYLVFKTFMEFTLICCIILVYQSTTILVNAFMNTNLRPLASFYSLKVKMCLI